VHSYLQLLERLEVAGNRYRRATDLLKFSSSSLGGAWRRVICTRRQFWKVSLNWPTSIKPGAQGAARLRHVCSDCAEQSQYDKIARKSGVFQLRLKRQRNDWLLRGESEESSHG
jgi:hypothetical protein